MRKFVIPEPINVMTADGSAQMKEPAPDGELRPLVMTLEKFLDFYVVNDPQCAKNMRAMKHTMALLDLAKHKPGEEVCLDEQAWELAKQVLEEPSQPYPHPHVLRQSWPFVKAICEAEEK